MISLVSHVAHSAYSWIDTVHVERFVRQTMLQSVVVMITREDLQNELERFATKEDLERFATKEDLERFATKKELEESIDETRRYMRVIAEDLSSKMQSGFEAIIGRFEALERRLPILDDHERRITTLEGRVTAIERPKKTS
jgi:hypothetical protein